MYGLTIYVVIGGFSLLADALLRGPSVMKNLKNNFEGFPAIATKNRIEQN